MEDKKSKTIKSRRAKRKKLVLEKLHKTPIVQIVCSQSGISRATYYRWIAEDKKFQKDTNEAIRTGELFINDLSESQIITLIKEKNWSAISFWLRHHHAKYADKLRIEANIHNDEKLTPEQKKTVKKALELASLNSLNKKENEKST